jgi:uncharacterized protein YcnI
MDLLKTSVIAALAVTAAGAAEAHVALTPKTAEAASYQVLRFGLGHGCDDKATTGLRIEIPQGVGSARPQPKAGWTLEIEHSADQRVDAISWHGDLGPDQFDEFLIQVRLPSEVGALAFPAVQTCGQTTVRWADPPGPHGEKTKHPPPTLLLTPPREGSSHSHQN